VTWTTACCVYESHQLRMTVFELCSFSQKPACITNDTLMSVVRVMLGCSERADDVDSALREGPIRFLSYLGGVELPSAISSVICERANGRQSKFPISSIEIEELLKHYLEFSFNASATDRIGAGDSYNFQRLVYNISACVVAFYEAQIDSSGSSSGNNSSSNRGRCVYELRCATEMVAIFANAVKRWMPVSPWFDDWWSEWHVLAFVMEMTAGTALSEGNAKWNSLGFLVFCDTIAGHALEERTKRPSNCITDYLSSSFSWVACSNAWISVLGSCEATAVRNWTPNALIFLKVADDMFNSSPRPSVQNRPSSPTGRIHKRRRHETNCSRNSAQ